VNHSQRLDACIASVGPHDEAALEQARRRLDSLTKPPGSLGRLERLAVQIAGITGNAWPRLATRVVVIMAADHGVTAEGVSAYPASVTAQMVSNFAGGGAAINVLARQAHAEVVVVDVGVAADLPRELPILHRKVAYGTANLATGPAMTAEQALAAIGVGLDLSATAADVICLGEMGIGNTTAAAAVAAALFGGGGNRWAGRGTGIDDEGLSRKRAAIDAALDRHKNMLDDPVRVAAALGGRELAALLGAALAARHKRVPVVIDGFVSTAAVAPLVRVRADALAHATAGHVSAEAGHRALLGELGLKPLLDLGMRLGEASGAAVAALILRAALACHTGMASFTEAGVAEKL
jgi:nicotinate-nucleotide--dimethylbenzimidazole phosphoribosyltransferase